MDRSRIPIRLDGFNRLSESKDDMNRVIISEETSESVPSESSEYVQYKERKTIRQKLQYILEHTYFHILVIVLVLIDLLLVIGELLLDLEILQGENELPCFCNSSKEGSHEVPPAEEIQTVIAEILHYMSIGILSVFVVEIMVKLYAFRLEYLKSKMEMFDAFIVMISFALDVAYATDTAISDAFGLFVVLRLWRIVRIFNGFLMSIRSQSEKKLELQKRKCQELEQELEKFRQYCSVQEKENEMLREELASHGLSTQEVEKKEKLEPDRSHQVDVVVEVNKLNIEQTSSSEEAQDSGSNCENNEHDPDHDTTNIFIKDLDNSSQDC